MNRDLYYAVLALDAYNRGIDATNRKLNVSGEKLGVYTVEKQELFDSANGFFAKQYTRGSETVISYRGTDFDQPADLFKDVLFGWSIAAGNFSSFNQVPDAITWLEPRLTPASQAYMTPFTRCYSPEEQARGSNPVMPPAQERTCSPTTITEFGGDLVYDTLCGDVDHRLRLFTCGDGYCGVYRWVARKGNPETGIFESIVLIRPGKGRCEPA